MKIQQLIEQRTKKVKKYKYGIFFNPSTAELRQWLKDKTLSKELRNEIYQFLLYRRQR